MPPLRRNGKQQACEPCRKGKLACDHAFPFCGRCTRRKTTARCVYHPAPMTKNKDPLGALASPVLTQPHQQHQQQHLHPLQQRTPSTPTVPPEHINSPQQPPEHFNSGFRPAMGHGHVPQHAPNHSQIPLNHSQTPPIHAQMSPNHAQAPPNHVQGPPSHVQIPAPHHQLTQNHVVPGHEPHYQDYNQRNHVQVPPQRYSGPTSFSAIFTEHPDVSGAHVDVGEERKHAPNYPYGTPQISLDGSDTPAAKMGLVLKTLENVPSHDVCFALLDKYKNTHISMADVLVRHAIETLWQTFGGYLAAPRVPEKLTAIADVLFANAQSPFPNPPDDGMDWLDTFMGPNMRFEMLGMLFCFFGMSYQALQDWDELLKAPENQGRDRKQMSWRMKECADICLKMCQLTEGNNEVSLSLQVCTAILEGLCTGEESLQLRRRHGDISVCTIAAGLHRLPVYGSHKVTAASEFKRRLFSSIYGSDKSHASLNGTPPALSARFCNLSLPLDIGEEELFLPQERLAKVIAKLDPNGWNTSGEFHRASSRRASHLLTGVREEILELSQGVDVIVSGSRIEDLHRHCQQVYDSLPPQLQYYAHDHTPKNSGSKDLIGQAYILLNYLQIQFLIDRVAITRGLPNEQGLLNTAMQMMDVTIMFWVKRDQLMNFSCSFDWVITCYGIPSIGVICVELLRQAAGQNTLQFSRSDAVQKLTMFIGFLDWVRPTDGNQLLVGRLKNVIRKTLDHVLDPSQKDASRNGYMDIPIDPMLAPFGEMDWFNTIDWMQGSCMDFN